MSDPILKSNKAQPEVTSSEDAIFDDIRPCRDDEAQHELEVIANDEALVNGIVKLRFPKLHKYFGPLFRFKVRSFIRSTLKNVHTIEDFQQLVAKAVVKMMDSTTDGVEFKGFENLDPNKAYLFISNHRDISLDPAFIDFALHSHHLATVRIAIGDNLRKIPAATALMRLNKSFIVKRGEMSPREKLRELQHLSQYMGLSLQENHSLWIAQREGRAKDGYDRTEDAVLKMIFLHGRGQGLDFATYMSSLNIVPVAITYEYDPNDLDKAHELHEKALHGSYKKGELEDIKSIVKGIKGYKGRVCVEAGEPITSGFSNPSELAALIDNFIFTHYALYPSMLISAQKLGMAPEHVLDNIKSEEIIKFMDRIHSYPEELQERIMRMYAAPYDNYQKAMAAAAASAATAADADATGAASSPEAGAANSPEAGAASDTAGAAGAEDPSSQK